MFAVGSPRFSLHCTLAKLLSVYLSSHLTIQQQGDKALIAEIKMSLLPSIQRVVSVGGGVGGGGDCTEVFSRVTVLSGTSKCRHGVPGENSQPIQIRALLVEDNTSQTRCCNRASWEMFEQHLCREFSGWGNKAGEDNLKPRGVYYHQRGRLGSQMALLHKPRATGCEMEVHFFTMGRSSYILGDPRVFLDLPFALPPRLCFKKRSHCNTCVLT